MRSHIRVSLLAVALVFSVVPAVDAQRPADTTSRPVVMQRMPPSAPIMSKRVAWTDSLHEPESVIVDREQGVYFVSNIQGKSLEKDRKAFISRFSSDGRRRELRWIESGRNGVELHAPKGMAIVGDTLWVTDIAMLRAFNRKTGAMLASIDLTSQGAAFLNDIAVGPDGAIYVTDTELEALPDGTNRHPRPDRIFRVAGRTATIALETDRLARPNGITWDAGNRRFIIAPLGGDTVMTWVPGSREVAPLATGLGQFDGTAMTRDGRFFVSSKATSAVHELRNGKLVKVIAHLTDPADIEIDEANDRIGIALTGANRVEWYRIPAP